MSKAHIDPKIANRIGLTVFLLLIVLFFISVLIGVSEHGSGYPFAAYILFVVPPGASVATQLWSKKHKFSMKTEVLCVGSYLAALVLAFAMGFSDTAKYLDGGRAVFITWGVFVTALIALTIYSATLKKSKLKGL